jgi:hypothetical protein
MRVCVESGFLSSLASMQKSQDFVAGEHEASIKLILKGQEAMQADITEIKLAVAERKGERRMVMWIVGGVSTMASVVISWFAARIH